MFGLFGKKTVKKPRFLVLDGGHDFDIVGESHYQDALTRLAGGKEDYSVELAVQAKLIPEPSNRYDKKAIRVEIDGRRVGYIARDETAAFHSILARNDAVAAYCEALIVGGWDRGDGDVGHFGVKLDLAWPPRGRIREAV